MVIFDRWLTKGNTNTMIMKLPKKEDPFKDDIERITKELKDKNIPKISEIEQKDR